MAGDVEVVKTLLGKGADVNAKDNNNFTPLMYAISRQRKEVIQTLLAAGAEPPPGFLQDEPEQKGDPS